MGEHAGEHRYLVVDEEDHGHSAAIQALESDPRVRVVSGAEVAGSEALGFGPSDRVMITSENVLDTVVRRLDDPALADLVQALKDKCRCRELLSDLYPDLGFRRLPSTAVDTIVVAPGEKLVVKPNKGYFATAVKVVDSRSDLAAIQDELIEEVRRNATVFADSVLSSAEVIVEDFIDGEEYAVDMFYAASGEPVVMNIYHHPIPANTDYLHVLYYTSRAVFDELYGPMRAWFARLNEKLGARAFPIHAEFRYADGKLTPIELNPLRFGGDGLADLAFHAFGVNAYAAYFHDRAPDWPALWDRAGDRIYGWMMGYNGTDVDLATHRPDVRRFQSLFEKILSDTVLNYRRHLAFSVVYIEESSMEHVRALVDTDFRDFFLGSTAFSEPALRQLGGAGVRQSYPAGATVWREGDSGDWVALVLEGELEVAGRSASGQEFVLDTVGPKCVVGEYSALDGLPRSATVRAASACRVTKISGEKFRRLLREAPELFEELYWQQIRRVRRMNERIAELEGARPRVP